MQQNVQRSRLSSNLLNFLMASIVVMTMLLTGCSSSPPDKMMQDYVTIQSKDGKILYKSNGSLKDVMENYWAPLAKSKIKTSKSGGSYVFSFKSKNYDKVEFTIAENGSLKKVIFTGGGQNLELSDDKPDAMLNLATGMFQFSEVNQ